MRFPSGWGSQISRQSAHEGGEVVCPTHRPPLPPTKYLGTHFCWRLSQHQGHSAAGRIMSMNISNDTIGNRTRDRPAGSACLNQLRHRIPPGQENKHVNIKAQWIEIRRESVRRNESSSFSYARRNFGFRTDEKFLYQLSENRQS